MDSVTAKENKGGLATRLKSALEQRKHRHKKQQDSSSRRFYLKNDNKLKELLFYNRMTMDEYFNQLIEREYQRVSGDHESFD
jgi:ribosomal protein S15P/S13E